MKTNLSHIAATAGTHKPFSSRLAFLAILLCTAMALSLTAAPQPAAAAGNAPEAGESSLGDARPDNPRPGQRSLSFEATADGRQLQLNYLLFLPESYGQDPNARWPLLLFLHGSREAGRDVNRVRNAILPQIVEQHPDFPFIVVSPQTPTSAAWDGSIPAIVALLDDLQTRLAVDPDRVYLTGLSLGGFGAWALAMREPNRFAAIVPVVGGYFFSASRLCPLKDIPTWVFHGKRDWNVPFRRSEAVVNALQACGGDPRFTIYEDADHDEGWRRAYNDPELYAWLLQQRRAAPAQ